MTPVGLAAGRYVGLMVALAALCVLALVAPRAAAADKPLRGVALVIGNGDYQHLPKLTNPPDDARAIEDLLSKLGFDTELCDRSRRAPPGPRPAQLRR